MSKRFYREDGRRHIKLGSRKKKISWRAPRGTQSKMRRKRKSYPAVVSIGYRTPRKDRKAHVSLLLIQTLNDLNKFEKGSNAILASTVGTKKRIEFIKLAKEKGVKLINVRESK
jgi:large subunit ribosomal protein L32e